MWRLSFATLFLLAILAFAERPFREYPGIEYNDFPLPSDYQEKTEWAFARLMYPSIPSARYDRWGADSSCATTSGASANGRCSWQA